MEKRIEKVTSGEQVLAGQKEKKEYSKPTFEHHDPLESVSVTYYYYYF
jgi:hypothetical protein